MTRPNGEIYISGENGGATLPQFSRDSKVMVQEDLVDKLLKSARLMSSELVIGEEDEVQGCDMLKTSVCFRPTSPDESPIMGALTDNVFACAGHGPWVNLAFTLCHRETHRTYFSGYIFRPREWAFDG